MAFVISPEDARGLAAEGHPVLPVGAELDPPKLIVVVPAARQRGNRRHAGDSPVHASSVPPADAIAAAVRPAASRGRG